jgi:transposase-like protein
MGQSRWSAEQKLGIALAVLRSEEAATQLCRRHGGSETAPCRRRDDFLEGVQAPRRARETAQRLSGPRAERHGRSVTDHRSSFTSHRFQDFTTGETGDSAPALATPPLVAVHIAAPRTARVHTHRREGHVPLVVEATAVGPDGSGGATLSCAQTWYATLSGNPLAGPGDHLLR